jgi:hypothetical protein
MINFPTAPALGDKVFILGIPVWTWNGNGWDRIQNGGVGDGNARLFAFINDVVPSEHETETINYV